MESFKWKAEARRISYSSRSDTCSEVKLDVTSGLVREQHLHRNLSRLPRTNPMKDGSPSKEDTSTRTSPDSSTDPGPDLLQVLNVQGGLHHVRRQHVQRSLGSHPCLGRIYVRSSCPSNNSSQGMDLRGPVQVWPVRPDMGLPDHLSPFGWVNGRTSMMLPSL